MFKAENKWNLLRSFHMGVLNRDQLSHKDNVTAFKFQFITEIECVKISHQFSLITNFQLV